MILNERERHAWQGLTERIAFAAAGLLIVGCFSFVVEASHAGAATGNWRKLAATPDKEGFAGSFSGVIGGSLMVAGGANFPAKKPWEGGTKVWSAEIFLLDRPNGEWKSAGQLPRPLGYGVSITTADGVICAGGSDSKRHYREVFLIARSGEKLHFKSLPELPQSCANTFGALLDNVIYVGGGIAEPGSTRALKTFWSLDLRRMGEGWKAEAVWPGPGRMLAVTGVQDGWLYVFSGAALKGDEQGRPTREWLRDAYRYKPGSGWERIAEMPRAAVAAPTPALSFHGRIMVFGGDDGSQVSVPAESHKGFPRDIIEYDVKADRWSGGEMLPFGLVTTSTVAWNEFLVVPGGEAHPGIRSNEVWAIHHNDAP